MKTTISVGSVPQREERDFDYEYIRNNPGVYYQPDNDYFRLVTIQTGVVLFVAVDNFNDSGVCVAEGWEGPRFQIDYRPLTITWRS